jgi:hypothetical protein
VIAGHTSWLFIARCTKGIVVHDQVVGHDEVLLMALTFGTLLSSQGADAHHLGPFGPVPGQPTKPYSVGFARSNLTGTARFPLGLRARTTTSLELGGCSAGSDWRLRAPNNTKVSTGAGCIKTGASPAIATIAFRGELPYP